MHLTSPLFVNKNVRISDEATHTSPKSMSSTDGTTYGNLPVAHTETCFVNGCTSTSSASVIGVSFSVRVESTTLAFYTTAKESQPNGSLSSE